MKKRGFPAIIALVLFSSVTLTAQTTIGSGKQNYVFADAVILIPASVGFGIGYERAVINNVSIALCFDYLNYLSLAEEKDTTYSWVAAFDISVRPRFYPRGAAVNGLFIGGMLGYSMITRHNEYDNYYNGNYIEESSDSAFTFGIESGWKFVFGNGMAIEPCLGYTIFGEYGGHLKLGVTLGYAWGGFAAPSRSRGSSGSGRRK
jgi:hypothetical protein